jgi:hypothetical protein
MKKILLVCCIALMGMAGADTYNQDVVGEGKVFSDFRLGDSLGDVIRGDGTGIEIGRQVTAGESEDKIFSGFRMNGSGGTFRVWGMMGGVSHSLSIDDATAIDATAAFRSTTTETKDIIDQPNGTMKGGASVIKANFTGDAEEEVIGLSGGIHPRPVKLGETELKGTFHIESGVTV